MKISSTGRRNKKKRVLSIAVLAHHHAQLHQMVDVTQADPHCCPIKLDRLKKKRLMAKDALAAAQRARAAAPYAMAAE